MVFSSQLFIFCFLPAVLLLYYTVPGRHGRHGALTLVSYVFYGWANPLFVVLMFISTVIDYVCGLVMIGGLSPGSWGGSAPLLAPGGHRCRRQTIALTLSIVSNLSLLGFFKYFNLGAESYDSTVRWLHGTMGVDWLRPLNVALRVTLPLGISFYTFQSMSYSIDVYRGQARAIRNFVDFACYVSMFPQLVAGPIIRFSEVAKQLEARSHTLTKFARGVAFLSLGLAKKVLLANPCGKIADLAFDAAAPGVLGAWYGVTAYAFQIYYDFSGYSDMAIGLGLMLGFVFPRNFDSPYHSQSITEFWRRWHISLSSWLRDYLYIPLGGNRKGPIRTYVNLMTVMLLGGLWHGANWTFVIWGGIHGSMLAFERLLGQRHPLARCPRIVRTAVTFLVLLVTWVFFRCPTFTEALTYCGHMLGITPAAASTPVVRALLCQPYLLLMFTVAAVITWGAPGTWEYTRVIRWPKALVLSALLVVALAVLLTQEFNPFIYFIF